MVDGQQFPYVLQRDVQGNAGPQPLLPITLQYQFQAEAVLGLLDTGADVNVLPYRVGLTLGAVWDDQRTTVQLSGNLANYEARGILLMATVANFAPVRLAFAWTQAEHVPLILGQVNFFLEYDVCFYRSRSLFEVALKSE